MRTRIYGGMMLVTLITLLLASIFLSLLFYRGIENQIKTEIRNKAHIWAAAGRTVTRDEDFNAIINADTTGVRVTVIQPDGRVLFDNKSETESMDNHLNRPEIEQAAQNGFGEATRYSETLRARTFYYALRLEDGRIIRVSKETAVLAGMLAQSVPIVILLMLLVFAFNGWLSAKLTHNIIAPINRINIDDPGMKIYDELTMFIRTILHQRALIEDQVRDLAKRADTIQSIIDHMREGFLMLDNKGCVAGVNKSVLRIFGTDSDCAGKEYLYLTREVVFLDKVRLALSGCGGDMFLERERSYHVFFTPVADNGVIVLFVDITESRQAEQMRRAFTANVSHELKTPLTTLSGYAEMVQTGLANPEDIVHFAGKIRDEAAHMSALVDDILFLSKLDETEHKRVYEQVNLTQLAAEAVESRTEAAETGGVTLSFSPTGGDVVINANRMLLYEMLLNLIDNGIKYNEPQGRVTVEVNRADTGAVTVTVNDTGIGIPEAHLSRVFERFYRVDPSRSRKTGGTGLGLSIVKHIVQYHNGTVGIDSKVGEGTTIHVILSEV